MRITNRDRVVEKFHKSHQHYGITEVYDCLTCHIESTAIKVGLKQEFSIHEIEVRIEERYQAYLSGNNDALEVLISETLCDIHPIEI
ncbi:hypothetical protein LRP52_49145 [Photobacterium sp. ZSDE20]|nr:hypothetical protein [Photobacterium sp. ZSDE20]